MSAPYARRPGQSALDMAAAREFEEEVRAVLPDHCVVRTSSSVDLDYFIPPVVVEVKEKKQPLTARWHGGQDEEDLFIIDELTVRKALKHWPYVWFVMKDCPQDRIFLANIAEILSADRHRFNRNGKGKWVIDTSGLTIVNLDGVMDHIRMDLDSEFWKASCCVVTAPEV